MPKPLDRRRHLCGCGLDMRRDENAARVYPARCLAALAAGEAPHEAAVLIAVTDRPEPGVILTRRPETMRAVGPCRSATREGGTADSSTPYGERPYEGFIRRGTGVCRGTVPPDGSVPLGQGSLAGGGRGHGHGRHRDRIQAQSPAARSRRAPRRHLRGLHKPRRKLHHARPERAILSGAPSLAGTSEARRPFTVKLADLVRTSI